MEPIRQTAEDIFRDRIRRARAMTPEERMILGPRLFAYACRITLEGIRNQYPDLDEREARRILQRRLQWQRSRKES